MIWSWKKCLIVGLRIGIISASLIALFWAIWSIFAPVSAVTEIKFSDEESIFYLARGISKWFTCLLVIPFTVLITSIYGRMDKQNWYRYRPTYVRGFIGEEKYLNPVILCQFYGLIAGFIGGFAYGIVAEPDAKSVFVYVICVFVVILAVFADIFIRINQTFIQSFAGLIVGLAIGLIITSNFSFILELACIFIFIAVLLIIFMYRLIKPLFSSEY